MSGSATAPRLSPALERLRDETATLHEALDRGLDVVDRLSDAARRDRLVAAYAAFYLGADAALSDMLRDVEGLDYGSRGHARFFEAAVPSGFPDFPKPKSRAEAMGMLYVVEGSSLGGRMIARELAKKGVSDQNLAFLDPYGDAVGSRWRSFLLVLDREIGKSPTFLDDLAEGAVRAFVHARSVLSEVRP